MLESMMGGSLVGTWVPYLVRQLAKVLEQRKRLRKASTTKQVEIEPDPKFPSPCVGPSSAFDYPAGREVYEKFKRL
jgi:hypothetical protein